MVSNPTTCWCVMHWVSTPRGMKCLQHKKTGGAVRPLERGLIAEDHMMLPTEPAKKLSAEINVELVGSQEVFGQHEQGIACPDSGYSIWVTQNGKDLMCRAGA